MEKVRHISPTVLDVFLSHFRIERAYRRNWTCFAGSTSFSDTHTANESQLSYSVDNPPKVATAWSYNILTGLTQGIYLATLFSMPLLDWKNEKNWVGGFRIYLVFAVPLTLITFGIWWMWKSVLEKNY